MSSMAGANDGRLQPRSFLRRMALETAAGQPQGDRFAKFCGEEIIAAKIKLRLQAETAMGHPDLAHRLFVFLIESAGDNDFPMPELHVLGVADDA